MRCGFLHCPSGLWKKRCRWHALPHWAPPFDGSALEGAVGGPSNRTWAPPADTSTSTRRDTPPMGHLGSPTRPAGVHHSTRRRDHRDSPPPDYVLSISVRDLFAFLRTQCSLSCKLSREGDRRLSRMIPWIPPDGVPSWRTPLRPGPDPSKLPHGKRRTSGHQAPCGTVKPPQGHRNFAPSCVGPQSTQVAPATRSAQDLGSSASIDYPLDTPGETQASSGRQSYSTHCPHWKLAERGRPGFPPQTGHHNLPFVRPEVGTSAPHHSGFCGLPSLPHFSSSSGGLP
ncbi:hypothetical protein ACOMHN_046072 [Nucella lapillus]